MKLRELKSLLRVNPAAQPRFTLPTGEQIPAHFHLTEVGHVVKKFIDCGGTLRANETCVLQTHVADDFEHRLAAGRFADILDLGQTILPSDDLEVEVEWDCCVISQYPIASAEVSGERIEFQLGDKHTDCLATEKCGCGAGSEASAESACCR